MTFYIKIYSFLLINVVVGLHSGLQDLPVTLVLSVMKIDESEHIGL